jgi:serine/threonine protein kinase
MDEDRLADLLLEWEEVQGQGRDISTAHLCRDCPELTQELERQINALKKMNWLTQDLPETMRPTDSQRERGTILSDRYRLDSVLGEGGFAVVWRGFDLELQRSVAIKIPKPSRWFSPEQLARVLAEARRLARLRHPGIAAVHDVVHQGSTCFIVSDLIEGENLAERLRKSRPSPNKSARIVADLAEILNYAHHEGFVHRDLKPANVLIDQQGHVFITDFGIALTEAELLRKSIDSYGTLAYMSPEQIGGQHPLDVRTDIYSLGVVFYELLTGRPPFQAQTQADLRQHILSGAPPPPSSLDQAVSRHLERICLKCLAKEQAQRYPDAQELAHDLRTYLRSRSRRIRRYRFLLVALGASLLLGFWVIWSNQRRPGPIAPPAAGATPSAREDQQPELRKATREENPSLPEVRRLLGHTDRVLCVAYAPDGKMIATGSADQTVRLWDLTQSDPKENQPILPQGAAAVSLAFAPDGNRWACGTADGTIRLWRKESGAWQEWRVLPGHQGAVNTVAFSADSHFLVSGGDDGITKIWDLAGAKSSVTALPKITGSVLSAHFLPKGYTFQVIFGKGSKQQGEVWFCELVLNQGAARIVPRETVTLPGTDDVRSVAVSPDGSTVLAAHGKWVRAWSRTGEQRVLAVLGASTVGLMGSPPGQGSLLATSALIPGRPEPRGQVLGLFDRHTAPVTNLALSPDSSYALTYGQDEAVRVWETKTLKEIHYFPIQDDKIRSLCISPDSRHLATGNDDGSVRLWSLAR